PAELVDEGDKKDGEGETHAEGDEDGEAGYGDDDPAIEPARAPQPLRLGEVVCCHAEWLLTLPTDPARVPGSAWPALHRRRAWGPSGREPAGPESGAAPRPYPTGRPLRLHGRTPGEWPGHRPRRRAAARQARPDRRREGRRHRRRARLPRAPL